MVEFEFEEKLERLVNDYIAKSEAGTRNSIMARYIQSCLKNFDDAEAQLEDLWESEREGGGL